MQELCSLLICLFGAYKSLPSNKMGSRTVGHFHFLEFFGQLFPDQRLVGPVVCSDPGRTDGPLVKLLKWDYTLRMLLREMKRKGISSVLETILEIVNTLTSTMVSCA